MFEQETAIVKQLRYIAFFGVALILFANSGYAQKKPTRRTTLKKPVATTSMIPPLEVRAARQKVEIQVSNVNRFVHVLGPIAQGIETIEASAKTRRLPQKTAEQNEANKRKVVEAIRNLNAGLATLETEFRTKPALQKYLSSINGITDLGAESEDSAIAGKFVAAKDPLRDIARKLSDTLALLPR